MRQVAKAIKECPEAADRESLSSLHEKCFSPEASAGPAMNVTWDVEERKTARSPYQGYVEFDLPSTWGVIPIQPTDQKVAKLCKRDYSTEAQRTSWEAQWALGVMLGLGNDIEPPRSKVWHYRFEFDVGSDNPELMKTLWVDETGKANPMTAGYSCWVKAAQSVGNAKHDASTPPQARGR
jgi:hypothetical protein